MAVTAFATRENIPALRGRLAEIASKGRASAASITAALVSAFEATVDRFLEDGSLSEAEEQHLIQTTTELGLKQDVLDVNGAYTRVARAGALREILEGKATTRLQITGSLPFKMLSKEKLLWLFPRVPYLEDKTRREYVGRSQGVSIRIMKGVYYRVGDFKGNAIERTDRLLVDTGLLAVTNLHVHFGGPAKSLRIRHDKIISCTPFADGVAIHRDAQNAKPQVFVTGDGWFTYNLLMNAAAVE